MLYSHTHTHTHTHTAHRSGEAGGGWGNSDTHTQQLTTPSLPVTTDPQISQLQDNHIVTTEQYVLLHHSINRCTLLFLVSQFCRDEDRNTEQERRLVDDITAPGGVKAAPPRDSLNKFISRSALIQYMCVHVCTCVYMYWMKVFVCVCMCL